MRKLHPLSPRDLHLFTPHSETPQRLVSVADSTVRRNAAERIVCKNVHSGLEKPQTI